MPHFPSHPIGRRGLCAAGLGLMGLLSLPHGARAAQASRETLDKLSDAQAQVDEVQAQLDQLAADYSSLAQENAQTMAEADRTQEAIAEVEGQIAEKQAQLDEKRQVLAKRVATNYKAGDANLLTLLMSSTTFDELTSNIYYANKVAEADQDLIDQVTAAKEALDQSRTELVQRKNELDALKEQQAEQMRQMQETQAKTQETLDGLSQEVRDLMAQRDAEILASAQAEAEEHRKYEAEQARRQQAAAAAAAASSATSSGGSSSSSSSSSSGSSASAASSKAGAIVAACSRVPSPGAGLCAMWVSQVYAAAGLGYPGGNACDMYYRLGGQGAIQPGMAIAVSTHSATAAGRIYGHVGIYIGNGAVMDNVGYVRTTSLSYWKGFYGDIVAPRWGYL